jgi:ribosomal protein L1
MKHRSLIPTEDLRCRLPNVPRPRMSICILADAADIDRAKQIDLEYMSVDDLKKCVSMLYANVVFCFVFCFG